MKIICFQENLKNGLNAVQNIVGKNLLLPILSNILLETKNGRLKISATNLEVGINCWVAGKIEEEGKITIPAKPLANFVNTLPNKKIDLTVDNKNNSLLIKCDNYKTIFKGLSADEFPIIPELKDEPFCLINSDTLKRSLVQVVNIASFSESRPEISGIYFKFENKNLKLVATDSFRLIEKNIYKTNNQNEENIIIPQRTIQELIKIINQKNGDLKIILNKNQILFDGDDVQLISRLIDGQYPNYEQIIPSDLKMQVVLNKDEFLNLIKTASVFSGKKAAIKVLIDPQKSLLEIFAEDSELGESKSQMPVEISDGGEEKIEMNLNYKYLMEGLINLDDKKIILGVNDSFSPVVIKGTSDNNYLYLVMPIKS